MSAYDAPCSAEGCDACEPYPTESDAASDASGERAHNGRAIDGQVQS